MGGGYYSQLLNSKNDYVFKRIFGHEGNESITKSFISAILNQNITDVVLESSSTMPKDMLDDKVGILDIKAKIDNTINCDIEMQVVDEKNVEKRITFYVSRMYTQTIHECQDYSDLQKCIAILITDYEIFSLQNKTIEIAKKMKAEGFDINQIIKITNLSVEEIEKL